LDGGIATNLRTAGFIRRRLGINEDDEGEEETRNNKRNEEGGGVHFEFV
jgi:hypothetical protein